MSLLRAFAGAAPVLAGLAAAVSACSSSNSPGYAQSSSSSGALGDGGDASSSADGSKLPTPQPALCQGLVLSPKVTVELALTGNAPPPLGGQFAAGTYDLEELDSYGTFDAGVRDGGEGPGSGLTGRSGSGTLIVTKTTLAFLEASGPTGALGAATATGYAYSALDTTLFAAKVCPETVATKGIPYSAVGDALALFVDPAHREVFRRRP